MNSKSHHGKVTRLSCKLEHTVMYRTLRQNITLCTNSTLDSETGLIYTSVMFWRFNCTETSKFKMIVIHLLPIMSDHQKLFPHNLWSGEWSLSLSKPNSHPRPKKGKGSEGKDNRRFGSTGDSLTRKFVFVTVKKIFCAFQEDRKILKLKYIDDNPSQKIKKFNHSTRGSLACFFCHALTLNTGSIYTGDTSGQA